MFENFEILHTPAPELKINVWTDKETTEITVLDDYSNIPFALCLDFASSEAQNIDLHNRNKHTSADPVDPTDPVRGPLLRTSRPQAPGVRMT